MLQNICATILLHGSGMYHHTHSHMSISYDTESSVNYLLPAQNIGPYDLFSEDILPLRSGKFAIGCIYLLVGGDFGLRNFYSPAGTSPSVPLEG